MNDVPVPLQLAPSPGSDALEPSAGRFIIGQFDNDSIVVYQAFNRSIADAAVADQRFGGGGYLPMRMTWIKPGFLWMMYRCGWATKDADQAAVLAIRMSRDGFHEILAAAVHTTWKRSVYSTEADWKAALKQSPVRVQWDPDRGLRGHALPRRAIQLGLGGEFARRYASGEWIRSIHDITAFVRDTDERIRARTIGHPELPVEAVMPVADEALAARLLINDDASDQ